MNDMEDCGLRGESAQIVFYALQGAARIFRGSFVVSV
jgi:hypothetical protein